MVCLVIGQVITENEGKVDFDLIFTNQYLF